MFQLKEQVGEAAIARREGSFIRRAIERWEHVPGIGILGDRHARRLSIVSFTVRHSGRYLHHNLVVALLNDLFGIQSRGGCSCAGPYGHRLLGIDLETSHRFEQEILLGCEGIKPGWVRVNFNYFISETVFQYILDAVELVATEGWRLLPQYRFDAVDRPLAPCGRCRARRPCRWRTSGTTDGVMRYDAHRTTAARVGARASTSPDARALLRGIAADVDGPAAVRRVTSASTSSSTTCAGS